jgi:hypothetical protein
MVKELMVIKTEFGAGFFLALFDKLVLRLGTNI